MEAIAELKLQYLLIKLGFGNIQVCIDWAVERLQLNQEGGDLDVVLLAGSTKYDEAFPLVGKIVLKYASIDSKDEELAAGKLIANLYKDYKSGIESIDSLDSKLTKLDYSLDHPDWLLMLSRNCEYATDIDVFREPFEQEFSYIAELWASSATHSEFESKYSRAVSNGHDAKYC